MPALTPIDEFEAYAYLNKVLVAEVTTTVRGIAQEVTVGRLAVKFGRVAALGFGVLRMAESRFLTT